MNHCHVRCVAEEHGRTMSPPQFVYIVRVVIYLGLKKILSMRRVLHGTPSPVPSHGRTLRRMVLGITGADTKGPARTHGRLHTSPLVQITQNTPYYLNQRMSNGLAPSPNPANRSSPDMGLFLFLEAHMAEKISRFTILVRDMRAAQKRYFDTRDKADLSRAKELERKVDDELAVIFGGVRTQGSLL